jgi:farnesyl-diphosphate farnesyltransferase
MASENFRLHFPYAEKMLLVVSRTFALNINVLSGKLRQSVLFAYLYLRIADTLEDDVELPPDEKCRLLSLFSAIFEDGADVQARLAGFETALPADWKTSEDPNRELCARAGWVVPLLWELPRKFVRPVCAVVVEMCGGMFRSVKRQEAALAAGWLSLNTVAELEEYCYFVAGIVGKMLTDVFAADCRLIFEKRRQMMKKLDVSFGLALQLVNIIKDAREDSERKVCFVPEELCVKHGFAHSRDMFAEGASETDRAAVMRELCVHAWKHLEDAIRYTIEIPRVYPRLRLFCLWPLFMAAENLVVFGDCSKLFDAGKKAKITRGDVKRITRSTLLHFYSDGWILRRFETLRAQTV